jgi:hypothetical protein
MSGDLASLAKEMTPYDASWLPLRPRVARVVRFPGDSCTDAGWISVRHSLVSAVRLPGPEAAEGLR